MLLSLLSFLGHLHPLLVHLPIGFLLMGLLLDLLSRRPRYAISRQVIKLVLLAGMFSAMASCVTGYILKIDGDYEEGLAAWHMWMGLGVVALSMLLFVKVTKQKRDIYYRAYSVGLLVLITITGHLGGSLTHGPDYLSAAWESQSEPDQSQPRKPIPNIMEAKVFGEVIEPILQARCVGCHGPNRQKARLRLDDSTWILQGGKDGAVLIAGKAAQSALIKRIKLSIDEEEHMPPKEKPQLKVQEIALLQWWVAQGADFNKKVKEVPQPGRVPDYLLALQQGYANGGADLQEVLVPPEPVDPASGEDIEALRSKKVIVLPLAQNTHYLSVNFINATSFSEKDMALLLPLKKQLVSLRLDGAPISDSALAFIGQCDAIRTLSLNNTRVTDKGLKQLDSLHNLRQLNLVGTAVSVHGVLGLQHIKTLHALYLYRSAVSSGDYQVLKAHFPKTVLDTGGYLIPFLAKDTVNELRKK